MSAPSEKATNLAEELVDYVHPGMSRNAAAREIATMIDSMNAELIATVTSLLQEPETAPHTRRVMLLDNLRVLIAAYKPVELDSSAQHELFDPTGHPITSDTHIIAGKMP